MIHVVLILLGKILLDVVPGMRQDASWTIVNLGYIAVSTPDDDKHECSNFVVLVWVHQLTE